MLIGHSRSMFSCLPNRHIMSLNSKMMHCLVSIFILLHLVTTLSSAYVRLIKYRVVHEHNLGNKGIECASSIRNTSFVAAKLHATSGDCEGLTWQWGENKDYMTDYAYIEKTLITEIYTTQLTKTLKYLRPFNISNGGKVEIAFTVPNDTENKFTVSLVDSLDLSFNTGDDIIEHIPVRIRFEISGKQVTVLSSVNGTFTSHEVVHPFTITIGVPHKMTIRIFETDIKVLLDGLTLSRYTPTVPPACSRLLRVRANVHNVTFKAG